jgi:hypothetical protein
LKIGRDREKYPPDFCADVSVAKSLVAACIFLMLAGSASINAAAPGFLEGHFKIVSLNKVEPLLTKCRDRA